MQTTRASQSIFCLIVFQILIVGIFKHKVARPLCHLTLYNIHSLVWFSSFLHEKTVDKYTISSLALQTWNFKL